MMVGIDVKTSIWKLQLIYFTFIPITVICPENYCLADWCSIGKADKANCSVIIV